MKHTGSCHCQKVRFEIETDIAKALACNCSICSKRGTLLTFLPEEQFTLLSGEDALTDYLFNKKVLHHYFCGTCGVATFASGVGRDGKPMRAINIRCLDDFDLSQVPVTEFDGKSL